MAPGASEAWTLDISGYDFTVCSWWRLNGVPKQRHSATSAGTTTDDEDDLVEIYPLQAVHGNFPPRP